MTASELGPLVADLAGTLDLRIDQPLVGVALFGTSPPAIGRYTIERRLGAGASAVVYAAHDTALDRPVALKIIARRDAHGTWCTRTHHEARSLARLSHPNVVAVHDVGEWEGHPFVAMELVTGVTLARWQIDARQAWQAILGCYLAAGRGLEAAHSIGLVHRDFKPANVLVADSGRIVVGDFGLAALIDPAATRPAIAGSPAGGTPAYVAPEQGDGAPPRPSADVYSFSLALCEALLGRHPLLGSPLDWRRALGSTGLPRTIRAAIERGMAADPVQRWPDMGPLLAAIEAALPASPARRRRAAGVALVLGLGLAAGVAGFARHPDVEDRPPPDPRVATARELVTGNPTAAAALLREVPAARRRDDWSAAARATLLRPLARELRCEDSQPATTSVGHGMLAEVDLAGRATVCELATEQVAMLTDNAICARALDRDHVGVFTSDGNLAIFERQVGWQLRRRILLGPQLSGVAQMRLRCDRDLGIAGRRWSVRRRDDQTWRIIDLSTPASERLIANREVVTVQVSDLIVSKLPLLEEVAWIATHAHLSEIAIAELGTANEVTRGVPILEVAPGRRMAVAGNARGTLQWWPLAGDSRAPWRESVSDARIVQIAFNGAGTRLVWRDEHGGIGVRDVAGSSSHELPIDMRSICQVGFTTVDRVVAVSCDGQVLEWDLAEPRSYVAARQDLAHCQPGCDPSAKEIWSLSINPGGSVAAAAGNDGTVSVLSLEGNAPVSRSLVLGIGPRTFTTLFAGDHLLVGGHGSSAELWDWRAGKRLAELPGHAVWVYAVAMARPALGPATIITAARNAVLRFWSEDGRRLRATTAMSELNTGVADLAVSPDGGRVAAALHAGLVVICDVATGAVIARVTAHRGWARRVVFLDDDTLLSAGDDGVVNRIAVTSGTVTSRIHAHGRPIYDVDRLGDSLLTASGDGTIRLWDLSSGSLVRTYVGHQQLVGTVRWHAGGRRFVSASHDGRACVWRIDRETCESWLIGHRGEVRSAQFIGEARVVTASMDGTVRVWTPVAPASGTVASLSAELARRAPACLDEQQRMSHLGEASREALARARACRAEPMAR